MEDWGLGRRVPANLHLPVHFSLHLLRLSARTFSFDFQLFHIFFHCEILMLLLD